MTSPPILMKLKFLFEILKAKQIPAKTFSTLFVDFFFAEKITKVGKKKFLGKKTQKNFSPLFCQAECGFRAFIGKVGKNRKKFFPHFFVKQNATLEHLGKKILKKQLKIFHTLNTIKDMCFSFFFQWGKILGEIFIFFSPNRLKPQQNKKKSGEKNKNKFFPTFPHRQIFFHTPTLKIEICAAGEKCR